MGFSIPRPLNRASAYSLVELMVACAILAVIAAIILPAVMSARGAGYRAVCFSNLHQLGVSCYLYADAWNERLPPFTNIEVDIAGWERWNGVDTASDLPTDSDWPRLLRKSLEPYGAEGDIWYCLLDPNRGKPVYALSIRHEHTSYAYLAPSEFMRRWRRGHRGEWPIQPPFSAFSGRLSALGSDDGLFTEPGVELTGPVNDVRARPYHGSIACKLFADLSVRTRRVGWIRVSD